MALSTAAELFARSHAVALKCLYHPFVYGLASGKLPQAAFQNYVGQDFFFLHSFSDAYIKAGSIAREKGDSKGAEKFASLANGVAEELKLHESYAAKWGVDLRKVEAQEATLRYVRFLQDTAASQQRISVICAAMAPCMRLYAFLGQSLQKGLPQGVEGNPYQEWVESYRSEDFEGLAVTLEELLNDYAQQESTTVGDLEEHFNKAMDLEFAFFDAQPGVRDSVSVPLLDPKAFAVDFDQTITEEDTSAVIAAASRDALPSEEERAARNSRWDALAEGFFARYEAQLQGLMPAGGGRGGYDPEGLGKFCEGMSKFDREALAPVEKGGFLSGVSKDALQAAAKTVVLRPSSLATLHAAGTRGAKLHVVSVNWSQDFIRGALAGCPQFELHSPDLVFESGLSTGRLVPEGIAGSVDKEQVLDGICAAGGGTCVYVGDSLTDVLALLRADVGIIVGSSGSLRRVCEAFGVSLRPLIGSVLSAGGEREKGVLYVALSWDDISLALYGATQ
eukprot:CAMPEP_0206217664 /NCGR_PEP_ID=MMETSP0047_2-20121206/3393_1 /ASSEMBLY_ACC=CAM_ASM_000192 /TAXON_ID=195065 /ORGANISM="Chroomonas mesostigmatica_cf, Strain CCMP1168" /LENGTH=505 /DNA_ID=CAMNT_0053640129 /DNA_START=298 /DNA_END=1815 /DNA_ORIENTATION=+